MTDTTDQQAVTVAQDDEWHRALAIKRYADPAVQRVAYLLACQLGLLGKGQLTDFHEGQCAISAAESMVEGVRSTDARLTSVSSASAEKRQCSVCTAIVASYKGGMCCHCHELPWALIVPTPEPVPATNQAGEVERIIGWIDQVIALANGHNPSEALWLSEKRWRLVRSALAAQFATAQERAALKPFADAAADYDYHNGQPAFDEYPDASSLPEINDLTIGNLRAARAALAAAQAALNEKDKPA